MPRKSQHLKTKIETRLSLHDIDRLGNLAKAKQLTKAEFAREAIRWYLDHNELLEHLRSERQIATALKALTDRVCGMLARQGAQVGTLYELAWLNHVDNKIEPRFISAANTVKQNMRKRLTEDERALAEKMRRVVSHDDSEAQLHLGSN